MRHLALVLVIGFLNFSNIFGQDKKEKLTKILEDIDRYECVDDKGVGVSGIQSEQYKRFIYLQQNLSESELIELTNHSSPNVRCYAFWALAKKYPKKKIIKQVLTTHLKDEKEIQYRAGCLRMRWSVSDFMFNVITANHIIDNDCLKLSEKEINAFFK